MSDYLDRVSGRVREEVALIEYSVVKGDVILGKETNGSCTYTEYFRHVVFTQTISSTISQEFSYRTASAISSISKSKLQAFFIF